jgi:hypothetical protein
LLPNRLVDVSASSGSEELSNFGKAFDIPLLKASTGSVSQQEIETLITARAARET